MATVVLEAVRPSASLPKVSTPTALYILSAAIILGGSAAFMASDHWMDISSRDLWQHTAALKALIADIHHPSNPFVNSNEPSRHFSPYWWAIAVIARWSGLSALQAINVAAFVGAAVLALGFYLFGRAYFRSKWGPLATLLCCTLSWSLPISHTGFINIPTLVEGIAYPAPLLVGLSLTLWALVIWSFEKAWVQVLIVPLTALMVSIHQLGALLAAVVAVPLALAWPGRFKVRISLLGAMIAGVALSTLWIYFNPIEAVILAGNPTWKHGVSFYSVKLLAGIFVPSVVGIIGLLRSRYGGPGKPLLIAFVLSLAAFVSGSFGILIATRFAPLTVMLLQIGFASQLVPFLENPADYSDSYKRWTGLGVYAVLLFETVVTGVSMFPEQARWERKFGNAMAEAAALTANIPDSQQVAAYDAAAYPVAATGQKVLSVPWPEPFISDLAARQQKVEQLFDWRLSRQQRVALAKKYGVRTLILDDRFGPLDEPREWKAQQLRVFLSQSVGTWHAGPMWRFDLY